MQQPFADATAEQGLGFQLYDEPMERVNVAQFCVLYVVMESESCCMTGVWCRCRSFGSLIVYPAMGIMERLMGMVFHRLGWLVVKACGVGAE